ncbi:MAG: PAS domain S-box protein [Nitrospinae bacterium]|nr:PAS domain S-box protein [Nitrospinota bacterium]
MTMESTLDDLSRDGLITLDRKGTVVVANRAADRLLADGAPIVGRPFAPLIRPLLDPHAPALYDPCALLDGEGMRQGAVTLVIRGRRRPFRYRLAPVGQGRWGLALEPWSDGEGEPDLPVPAATLAAALESVYEAVVITDVDGYIRYVNPAFENVTGYRKEEVVGQTPRILKSDMHGSTLYEELWRTIKGGETWRGDLINRRKDGSVYYDHASISPVRDKTGAIVSFISIKQNITEKKLTEQALTEQREQLRMITDHLPALITYVDRHERYQFVNRAYEQWVGRPAEKIVGRTLAEILDPAIYAELGGRLRAALKGERVSFERETQLDGRWQVLNVAYIPHRDSTGAVRGVFTLATDITERKERERELSWSHRLLDAISAAQSQFIVDADTHVVFSRLLETLLSLTGSAHGFIGQVVEDPPHEPQMKIHAVIGFHGAGAESAPATDVESIALALLDDLFGAVLESGEPVIVNATPGAAGEGKPESFLGIPIVKGGRVLGEIGIANRPGGYHEGLVKALAPFIGACANVFEAMRLQEARREVEEALIKSQDSLAKAQWIAHVGNWDWNITSDELTWSDEMYRIFDLDPTGSPGNFESFITHIHPADLTRVRRAITAAINETGSYQLDHRIVRPDGRERIVIDQGEVFYDTGGRAVRMVGTLSDITVRKTLENELREQTEKLQELDSFKNRLMSIVSHDLRSPLTSNIGLLTLLTRPGKEPMTERQTTIVQTVVRSLQHQLKLVENLLELSRVYRGNIQIEQEPLPVNELFEASVAMLSQVAAEKEVQLVIVPAGEGRLLFADRHRMIQVINNLLTNAIKFSRPGETIELRSELTKGGTVDLLIVDHGIGIAADRMEKLFDLSYSTTTLGTGGEKGTGLGLSICQELTELNGGVLSIVSTEGKGTTVRLAFPVCESATVEGGSAPSQSSEM